MKTFTVSVVILALLLMQEIHQTQAFGELQLSKSYIKFII